MKKPRISWKLEQLSIKFNRLTKEQLVSLSLMELTTPIKFNIEYYLYLMEWLRLNKN